MGGVYVITFVFVKFIFVIYNYICKILYVLIPINAKVIAEQIRSILPLWNKSNIFVIVQDYFLCYSVENTIKFSETKVSQL